jgi:ADP-ribose pyrophosphatase
MSTKSTPSNGSKLLAKSPLSPDEANWIQLSKITWEDPNGVERIWETAERKTRNDGGIDGNISRSCGYG